MRSLYSLFFAFATLAVCQTTVTSKDAAKQTQHFDFPKPFSPTAVQKALSGQTPVLVLPGTLPVDAVADEKVCAIRLLEYKGDSSVDPGILHSLGPSKGDATESTPTDKTPLRLPMAACPAQR